MTLYLTLAFIFNKWSVMNLWIFTVQISFMVEISQLYQADWINSIRSTLLGALLLGHGFLWSDFACYALGATMGKALDSFFIKKSEAKPT